MEEYVERSQRWPAEMRRVRPILLDAGLEESIKWAKPCYSIEGSNVVVLQEMKDFLALMFFKGVLLDAPDGVLTPQGPNSRSAMRVEITSVDDVDRLETALRDLVRQAIEVERSGAEVGPAPEPVLVDEMRARLDGDPDLAAAFAALTPGRRREYHLHVSSAKKSETRDSRLDACVPKILAGKGLRDR